MPFTAAHPAIVLPLAGRLRVPYATITAFAAAVLMFSLMAGRALRGTRTS
jgi:hypothetical protein